MKFPLRGITLTICSAALSTSLQLHADTITVANADDSGSGSLRAAIDAAVVTSGADTINFAPALNGATITLTSGHLSITGLQLTIDASALPAGIKISGNSNSRIFSITGSSNVALHSLELLNGSVTGLGGGIYADASQLNCTNITVRNCTSSGLGGGILAFQSQLIFDNVTIRDCISTYNGGGLYASNVTGTLDRCSFLGNDSQSFGGGIFLDGNNSPTIKNTIVSGNRCPLGAGISTASSAQIINCTIQGNSGPGIQLEGPAAPVLRNTIVWGNRTGDGTISSQQIRNGIGSSASADVKYSLVEGVPSSPSNLDGSLDPKFVNPATPLNSTTPPSTSADLRLLTGSPALNEGDHTENNTTTDLAGNPRKIGLIDLGAYEGAYATFALLNPGLDPNEDDNGNGISNFGDYAAGGNPTAPDDPSLRPTLSGDQLTFSYRDYALDIAKQFQKSTTLLPGSWTMIQASDYISSTTTSSGGRSLQTLTLDSTLLNANPKLFFREEFKSVP